VALRQSMNSVAERQPNWSGWSQHAPLGRKTPDQLRRHGAAELRNAVDQFIDLSQLRSQALEKSKALLATASQRLEQNRGEGPRPELSSTDLSPATDTPPRWSSCPSV